MRTKIRVYGKDQNRTALGIVNAYLKLYPDSTLEDLQKAFPYSINPTGTVKQTIVSTSEAAQKPDEFFEKPEDFITLKNGQKATLKYLWQKPDFEVIEEHAKQFGIKVASITETPPFKEGSYKLEMVDEGAPIYAATPNETIIEEVIIQDLTTGDEVIIVEEKEIIPEKKEPVHHVKQDVKKAAVTPPPTNTKKEEPKKKNNWWWWILLLLLLLLLLLGWRQCAQKKAIDEVAVIPFTETITEEVYEPYWDKRIAGATVTEEGKLIYGKDGQLIGIIIDGQTIDFDKLSTEAEINAFLKSSMKESGWIVLDQVHFKFNEVNFTQDALTQIKNVATMLKVYAPNAKIAIEGFSDHIGTNAENQAISDERAVQTKNHFVQSGFSENMVTSAIGLRDTQRLCQADDTPLCRAQNRRAEIKITK